MSQEVSEQLPWKISRGAGFAGTGLEVRQLQTLSWGFWAAMAGTGLRLCLWMDACLMALPSIRWREMRERRKPTGCQACLRVSMWKKPGTLHKSLLHACLILRLCSLTLLCCLKVVTFATRPMSCKKSSTQCNSTCEARQSLKSLKENAKAQRQASDIYRAVNGLPSTQFLRSYQELVQSTLPLPSVASQTAPYS